MTAPEDVRVEEVGARVEHLLDRLAERDRAGLALAEELVRELVGWYGAGLATILARLDAADPSARRELSDDPLVGGLLALHDHHPVPLRERVEAALDTCRPALASHGGDVRLVAVTDGVVRLRLEGSCDGCGASEVTLRHSVESAVLAAAPEVVAIDVDGAVPLGEGHAPPPGVALPLFPASAP